MADRRVSITFLNPKTKLIEQRELKLPTGTQAKMVATRNLAQDLARADGWRFFAIPSFVTKGGDIPERWLVFEMTRPVSSALATVAVLLRDWPTQAAAEMWMQHHA